LLVSDYLKENSGILSLQHLMFGLVELDSNAIYFVENFEGQNHMLSVFHPFIICRAKILEVHKFSNLMLFTYNIVKKMDYLTHKKKEKSTNTPLHLAHDS
jgi:hypothetical protein